VAGLEPCPARRIQQVVKRPGNVRAREQYEVDFTFPQCIHYRRVRMHGIDLRINGHLVDLGYLFQLGAQDIPAAIGAGHKDAQACHMWLERRRQALAAVNRRY
jgi:hypothetical protein